MRTCLDETTVFDWSEDPAINSRNRTGDTVRLYDDDTFILVKY